MQWRSLVEADNFRRSGGLTYYSDYVTSRGRESGSVKHSHLLEERGEVPDRAAISLPTAR